MVSSRPRLPCGLVSLSWRRAPPPRPSSSPAGRSRQAARSSSSDLKAGMRADSFVRRVTVQETEATSRTTISASCCERAEHVAGLAADLVEASARKARTAGQQQDQPRRQRRRARASSSADRAERQRRPARHCAATVPAPAERPSVRAGGTRCMNAEQQRARGGMGGDQREEHLRRVGDRRQRAPARSAATGPAPARHRRRCGCRA